MVRSTVGAGTAIAALLLAGAVVAPAAGAAGADPVRVVVTVTDGAVRAPLAVRPGLHRFLLRVRGGSPDGVQLVRPRAGYSAAEYRADEKLRALGTKSQARRAAQRIARNTRMWGGALADGSTSSVFWQRVPRGRLLLASETQPWKARLVAARGASLHTAAPTVTAVVTVTDGALTLPATLPATGTLLVRNTGSAPHSAGLAKLTDGATVTDVTAFFQAYADLLAGGSGDGATEPPVPDSPFDTSEWGVVTQLVHPGTSMYLQYRLPAGGYAALCTRMTGSFAAMHLMHGELAPVTVG